MAERHVDPWTLRTWLATLAVVCLPTTSSAAPTKETILFIRHAEKPKEGLGQLSCKGLNRALALGAVIAERYGKVDAVFAPDPSQKKEDGAGSFDYVRPLATIEPAAIRFGLPVNVAFGYKQTDKLIDALLAPEYRQATVLVAWEHHKLDSMVPRLVKDLGGDAKTIVAWAKDDFDSIWRLTVERDDETIKVSFNLDREGLDGQPETCPK